MTRRRRPVPQARHHPSRYVHNPVHQRREDPTTTPPHRQQQHHPREPSRPTSQSAHPKQSAHTVSSSTSQGSPPGKPSHDPSGLPLSHLTVGPRRSRPIPSAHPAPAPHHPPLCAVRTTPSTNAHGCTAHHSSRAPATTATLRHQRYRTSPPEPCAISMRPRLRCTWHPVRAHPIMAELRSLPIIPPSLAWPKSRADGRHRRRGAASAAPVPLLLTCRLTTSR